MHSIGGPWTPTKRRHHQDRSMGNALAAAYANLMDIDDDDLFDDRPHRKVRMPAGPSRPIAFVDLADEADTPTDEISDDDDECVESSQQPAQETIIDLLDSEEPAVLDSVVELVDDATVNPCEAALTVSLADIVEPLVSESEEEKEDQEENDKIETEEEDGAPTTTVHEPMETAMATTRLASIENDAAVIEIDDDDDEDNANGTSSADVSDEPIQQLLIYPPTGVGGISINTEDFMCLAKEEYLNDVIIDFYLKYVYAEVLSESQRQRTHIFSTFFYKRLLSSVATRRRGASGSSAGRITAAALERHSRVKNWTKHVNLFEKDFVFVPINERNHWYLAVICFPALTGPVARYGGNPIESLPSIVPVNRPCILILDSMDTTGHKATISRLQEYLACEYQAKFGEHRRSFSNETFPGHTLPVPQQDNYSDCGLFVLQFVEAFFDDPIRDFQRPDQIKRLADWFDCMVVLRKREEIALLLSSLVCQHNPANVALLPEIDLPTKDGKLL